MKVVCEICGGSLLKEGEYFVCQNCGCKYSINDVKNIMNGNTASFKNEKKDKIETYYNLIKNELSKRDFWTALQYCDKAIELDSKYYPVWYEKGYIALFSDNGSIEDGINYFDNAIKYCPNNEKTELRKKIAHSLQIFENDLLQKTIELYGNTLSLNTAEKFVNSVTTIMNLNGDKIKEKFGTTIQNDDFYMSMVEKAEYVFIAIWRRQIHDPSERLETYDGSRGSFLREIAGGFFEVALMFQMLMDDRWFLNPDDFCSRRAVIFDQVANMEDYVIANGGWTTKFQEELRNDNSIPAHELSAKLKERYAILKRKEAERQAMIERQEREKKIQKYWSENQEEYDKIRKYIEKLEKEVEEPLLAQKKILDDDLQYMPEKNRINEINSQIKISQKEINSLGFFKKKEKSILQEKIDNLEKEKSELEQVVQQKKISLNAQLCNIKNNIREVEGKKNKAMAYIENPFQNKL